MQISSTDKQDFIVERGMPSLSTNVFYLSAPFLILPILRILWLTCPQNLREQSHDLAGREHHLLGPLRPLVRGQDSAPGPGGQGEVVEASTVKQGNKYHHVFSSQGNSSLFKEVPLHMQKEVFPIRYLQMPPFACEVVLYH